MDKIQTDDFQRMQYKWPTHTFKKLRLTIHQLEKTMNVGRDVGEYYPDLLLVGISSSITTTADHTVIAQIRFRPRDPALYGCGLVQTEGNQHVTAACTTSIHNR